MVALEGVLSVRISPHFLEYTYIVSTVLHLPSRVKSSTGAGAPCLEPLRLKGILAKLSFGFNPLGLNIQQEAFEVELSGTEFEPHCTKNPIYVFPEMKLHGLVPNSSIHVSVTDFYTPRICLPIWLQQNSRTDPGKIHIRVNR